MRWTLIGWLAVAGCGDSGSPDVADAPRSSGACDASLEFVCGSCLETEMCVAYDQESGFPSCTDYHRCVPAMPACPPGTCSTECEAALCPDEWTCDPTATFQFTCTKP
jgi:hypothetical protein